MTSPQPTTGTPTASAQLASAPAGIPRHEITRTMIAAFVGIVVALILSPLTQSFSFFLNEYLARPILAIEYVEVVPEDAPTPLPSGEIQEFGQSGAARALIATGNRAVTTIIASEEHDSADAAELLSLKAAVDAVGRSLSRRAADLRGFLATLNSDATDRQIREVAQKFSATSAMMFGAVPDAKVIQRALLPQVAGEVRTTEEGTSAIRRLRTRLDGLHAPMSGKVWLKVSVANRGTSDGLVRNTGRIVFFSDSVVLPVRRANGPTPPHPADQAMGVPVNVLNPAPVEIRAASVGRVEKHSYAEFWFEVDDATVSVDARRRIWKSIHSNEMTGSHLALVDHENRRLEYPFAASGVPPDTAPERDRK